MKAKSIAALVCLILFLLLILLVKTTDVSAIGPENTRIGLSGINGTIHEATGVRMHWSKITNYMGYLSILVAVCFALLGLVQLIRRKSLKKVDPEIYALGGLYVLLAILYVLFEFIVINYRPVIMPGDAHVEASFPSSHTMLIFVILGSAAMVMDKYFRNQSVCRVLKLVFGILILIAVLGRLISGVHWFTDIIGGVLISAALLFLFASVLDKFSNAPCPDAPADA